MAFVMARFKVSLLFGVVFLITASLCAKLNVPRVLIPLFNQVQVNFTLEVTDGGCYKWSSSREEVVGVRALPGAGGCSSRALVQPAPRLRHRHTAIILAQDVHTQQILRCDVIVDSISSLEVVTTTRELFVEEAPEAFEIRAYDDQGNEFTTLEGVEFVWTLVSPLKDNDVIRVMTFSESLYEATDSLHTLEARGLRGHTALLEGVRTGSAKVLVRLPQVEYSAVGGVEVALRVVANLLVVPPDATLMLGDSLKFKIIQVREGRMIELPQPSPQYQLEIEDSSIAQLETRTGVAVGEKLGSTRVLLRDAGEMAGDVRPPEAALRVATPRALQLALEPLPPARPWALQAGQAATILVHILDNEDRRMQVGPETRVSVEVDETFFQVHWRSANGTVVTGLARRAGTLHVTATLVSVAGRTVQPRLSTSADIHIYRPIEIIPSDVVLPWNSNAKFRHDFQLRAVGGDGSYSWRSEGSAVGVGPRGLLSALAPGNGTVTVSMPANPHIYATASVLVVEPSRMEVVWSEREGPVGVGLALHVALYHSQGQGPALTYTNCDQLPFEVTTIEGVNFESMERDAELEKEELVGDACTIVYARCSEAGMASVSVRQGQLSHSLTLACHAPLRRLQPPPPQDILLLAVGSSANVIYTGGPQSWSGSPPPKKEALMANPGTASLAPYISQLVPHHLHVFTVTCLQIGETQMRLKLSGGGPSMGDTLGVACSAAHSLRLSLRRSLQTQCNFGQLLILSEGGLVEVEVSVLDARGHVFHNATSLPAGWTARPGALLPAAPGYLLSKLNREFAPIPVPEYHYQMLSIEATDLSSASGSGEVSLQLPGTSLATLPLKLVMPVQVADDKITVFLQSSPIQVNLTHGSGKFSIEPSELGAAGVKLDAPRSLRVQPLREGQATVVVRDLCINSPPVTLQINVVSVASIAVELPELIERGHSVECSVRLLGASGAGLAAGAEGAPRIMGRVGQGHITLEPGAAVAKYIVTGVEEGDALVEFTAGSARGSARTRVFPPLRILPRTSVVLTGGSLSFMSYGGPPASVRYYSSAPESVLKISPSGVLEGVSVGSATIEARAESASVVLGRATASVRVVQLEGVSIHAPTRSLLAGNTMPLWVNGIPDVITPLELGTLRPALHFRWAVSGDGVVRISDVLGDTNIELDDTDRVSVRLTALKPGRVIVHLNVTMERTLKGRVVPSWSARMQLEVPQPLLLAPPLLTPQPLLLAPLSSTQLDTSYEWKDITYSISEDPEGPLVQVSPEGRVTAGARLGRAILTIATMARDVQQVITLGVEVCPVHYSMLQLESMPLAGMAALPGGLALGLAATRHDATGRRMAGLASRLLAHSNRPDLQIYTNHSTGFEVLLTEPGRSVLRLTDASTDQHLLDYMTVKVQSAIYPRQVSATVGDVWCMRGALSAGWSSSDPSAVTVTSGGLAQARAPRPVATSLHMASPTVGLAATAPVLTRSADKISFLDMGREHVVTDEKPYTVPLVLSSREETDKKSNLILDNRDCLEGELTFFPFFCEVKPLTDGPPSSEFNVSPVFDMATGRYGCRMTWSPSASPNINTSGSVAVLARAGPEAAITVVVHTVRAACPRPSSLVLSSDAEAVLTVSAAADVLKQLSVISESAALEVGEAVLLSDTEVSYSVRAGRGSRGLQRASVRLQSPLTHQDTEIPVALGEAGMSIACAAESSPLLQMLYSNQLLFLLGVALLVLLGTVLYVYNNYYPVRYTQEDKDTNFQPNQHDISSQIRSLPYSRSPLSHSSPLPAASQSPSNLKGAGDTSAGAVYGDPSFLASPDRRRNRRFL